MPLTPYIIVITFQWLQNIGDKKHTGKVLEIGDKVLGFHFNDCWPQSVIFSDALLCSSANFGYQQ